MDESLLMLYQAHRRAVSEHESILLVLQRGIAELIVSLRPGEIPKSNQTHHRFAIVNQSLIDEGVPSRTFLIATLMAGSSKGQIDGPLKTTTTSTSAATSLGRKLLIPQSSSTITLCVIAGVGTMLFGDCSNACGRNWELEYRRLFCLAEALEHLRTSYCE
jgi:hypothetical protein